MGSIPGTVTLEWKRIEKDVKITTEDAECWKRRELSEGKGNGELG